jgi:nucleoside-diphosphate-sugar epimerase
MIHAVTGAYGYSGKYIAQRLLDAGETVITLTNSLARPNPFGDRIMAGLLYVDPPPAGQTALTDWVRQHADTLGRHCTSELARRKDQVAAYRSN